ncbi:AarF/UbiB family protein [Bacteriovorax sp. Seq25_V]|uniref:AarF/UbiB family protein n=1 Tax=Bacteriovorax sp. Seq25_V TaxID=1201288 RepID=UPI0018DF0389|nr:AarF/UbiB family protein [Bacteriovorax sp. Seq25_V]
MFLTIVSCGHVDKRGPDSINDEINIIAGQQWKNLKQERKLEVYKIRNNLIKFMLESCYKTDAQKIEAFKQAQAYLVDSTEKLGFNIKNDKLGNSDVYKVILDPPRWTLKDEVEWMNAQVKKTNPSALNVDGTSYLSHLSALDIGSLPDIQENDVFSNQDLSELMTALKSNNASDEVPLLVVNKFENKVTTYFDKIRNLGTELAATGQVNIGNEEAEKFFVKFLDYYYSNVDISVIKNILNDVVDIGREPTQMELVQVMFKNSGPGLGKTLQQMGKDPNMGDSLAEVISVLEDDGKAVPQYLVERTVKADKGGFRVSKISEKPLGTGTMAQVNKASLTRNGISEVVALRFLKPGIEARVNEDLKILKDFIEKMGNEGELSEDFLPSARKLVESISTFLKSELDIADAIKKQDYARKVYEQKINVVIDKKKYEVDIKVPKVYYPETGKKTKLHIQEFITFGEKFSSLDDKFARSAVAKAIMQTWFEEALIKSGFVHSDLHQGNFTVRNVTPDSAQVVLFDFGMSETLTKDTRQSFIMIGAGVEFKKPALIADGILLMDKEKASRQARKELIKKITAEINHIDKTEDWIVWALKEGHLKNDQLGTLARGGVLVSQLGKIVGNETMHEDIVEDLLAKNAIKAFGKNSDFPLTKGQVFRIGTSSCAKSIKSFFSFGKSK